MPSLLPSRAFRRPRERTSGLLLALGVDDLSATLPTGQTLAFDRGASRTVLDSAGRVATLVADQLPWGAVYNASEGVREPVLQVQRAETNYVLRSEDFGTTWVAVGTPTRIAAAATVGDLVLDLLGDDASGTLEGYTQAITPSGGNGTKGLTITLRAGTSTSSVVRVRDTTASANRLLATITWASGVPTVTMTTGIHCGTEPCSDGAYRFLFQTTTWTVANTTQVEIYPATTSALVTTNTGTLYAGGVQVNEHTYPTGGYRKTLGATVTGADDLVTATIDWAPQNFTVYVRFARPPWALATAPAGLTSNYLFSLGSSGAVFEGYWSQTASLWYAAISNGTTAVSATRAMPSGSMLEFCAQFDAVTTGARVRLDIGDGAGFSAYSSATGGVSAWGSSTFRVGHLNSAPVSALDSGIRKLVIAPGARTLAEMRGLNV
jgi:hypothetical protein